MKKTFTLFAFLSIISTALYSQTWINVQATGSNNSDAGNAICTDANSNVFVTGNFGDSVQFGSTVLHPSGNSLDIFIVKYNSSMNVVWAKRFGGVNNDYAYAIKTDAAGNIYIAGTYYTSITFDTITITQSGGPAIFIVKLNSSGTAVWAKSATSVGSDFYVNGLGLDAANNIYITGYYAGVADFGNSVTLSSIVHPLYGTRSIDIFTAKYNNSGTCQWARSAGSYQTDRSYGIAVASNGNAYIAGFYGQNANFSGYALSYVGGGTDAFIAGYDNNGNLIFLTNPTSADYESCYGIALDASENIYVTGLSSGATVYDTITITPHGSYDMFIAKYNSAGNIQWVQSTYSSQWEHGRNVVVDGGGNVYVGGEFYHGGTTSFPGIDFTSKGYYDPFVVKYNHVGEFQWAQRGGSYRYDYLNGIALADSGKIIITGSIGDTAWFSNFFLNYKGSPGGYDYYVAKIRSDINTGTITGLPSCAGSAVTVPYTANIPFNAGNVFTAQLSDAQGRFANAVNIGTVSSTVSGSIAAVIPANTPNGTGYRIRVISSDSARTGGDNGIDLSIWGVTSATITSSGTEFCSYDSLLLTAANVPGYSYQWKKGSTNIAGATSPTYYAKATGDYKVIITDLAHGCSATSNIIHAIKRNQPAATITAGGPVTFCAGGNVLLSANTGTNFSYLWKKNGNNINGATSSSYTAATSGTYTVLVTNVYGCTKLSSATIVTVNPLPSVSYTGLAPTYALNDAPAALTPSPTGGVFNGPGISGYTFFPSIAGYGGPYTITYTYTDINGCSNTASHQTSVTCVVPAVPGTITVTGGNKKVCPGNTRTYTIAAVSGAISYTWTPPAGSTITSGQGTVSVTVNYNAGFTGSDSIKVVSNSTCGSSAPKALLVQRNNPATPAAIAGQSFGVCNGIGINYSVAYTSGITYAWSFVNGANTLISGGQGTSAISVNYNAGYSVDTLRVSASNACGTSAYQKLTVKSTPETPSSIAGNTAVCANQQNVPYSISPVAYAANYTWTGPAGSHISDGTITSAGNTLVTTATAVTVDYGGTSGILKVRANNSCGSGNYRTVTITFICREGIVGNDIFNVNVHPNPSTGDFTFEIENARDENVSISIYDAIGKLILSETNINNNFIIHDSHLPPGIYSAVINNSIESRVLKIVKMK